MPGIRGGGEWNVVSLVLKRREKGQYLECGVAYKVTQQPLLKLSLAGDETVQNLIRTHKMSTRETEGN